MRKCWLLGISLLLLGGCAKIAQEQGITERVEPSGGGGQLLPGSNLQASGFLRDYGKLVEVASAKGTWEYVHPGVNWKVYTKILIEHNERFSNRVDDRVRKCPSILDLRELFSEHVSEHGGHPHRGGSLPNSQSRARPSAAGS